MMDLATTNCIGCDKPFSQVQPSAEHVIPNALGGRLETTSATCVGCNSSSGHTIDARFVRRFKPLAVALDVIRDRGDHPEVSFVDPHSRLEWYLRAGTGPYLAPNIRVERSGSLIEYEFNAPTREAAERIVRRIRPKRLTTAVQLTGTPRGAETSTWRVDVSANDEDVLRSVARIAVCYARHAGVPVIQSDRTLRFARGEQVTRPPVGIPRGDVVKMAHTSARPLYHAVYLAPAAPSGPLLAYVVLFQLFEFIVEFDTRAPAGWTPSSYQQNLVSGFIESWPFEWVATIDEVRGWVDARAPNHGRAALRASSLEYYLADPARIRMDRAKHIAVDDYFAARFAGESKDAAAAKATERLNSILSWYGLENPGFRFEESEEAAANE